MKTNWMPGPALSKPEVVERLKGIHKNLDKDQNGTLAFEEYAALALQLSDRKGGDQLVAQMRDRFERYDANKDGQLNVKEFIQGVTAEHRKPKPSAKPVKEESAGGSLWDKIKSFAPFALPLLAPITAPFVLFKKLFD